MQRRLAGERDIACLQHLHFAGQETLPTFDAQRVRRDDDAVGGRFRARVGEPFALSAEAATPQEATKLLADQLEQCLIRKLREWKFPPAPKGEETTLIYPFLVNSK